MQKVLTKRERLILYTTIGLIAFSMVFNFLISPLLKKNGDLNRQILVTHLKLAKYLSLLSQKDAIKAKYSKFSSTLRMPERKEDAVVTVLSEVERLADSSGVRITDVRPQPSRNSAQYKEVSIDLRTEADMGDYIKFIYAIDNSLLSLSIKKLQINSRPNSQYLEGLFSIRQLAASE